MNDVENASGDENGNEDAPGRVRRRHTHKDPRSQRQSHDGIVPCGRCLGPKGDNH